MGSLGLVPVLPLCPDDSKEQAGHLKSLWLAPSLQPHLLFALGQAAAGSWEEGQSLFGFVWVLRYGWMVCDENFLHP